jgi:hypothetical protein
MDELTPIERSDVVIRIIIVLQKYIATFDAENNLAEHEETVNLIGLLFHELYLCIVAATPAQKDREDDQDEPPTPDSYDDFLEGY